MSADLIARCTRDGVIQWGQVAKQLGVSIDRARRMYDPVSSSRQDPQQIGDWAMPQEVDAALLPDAEAYKSPHPKGDGQKLKILALLERSNHSAEVLASLLNATASGVRSRLSELQREGKVYSDDEFPRTWGRVEDNGLRRVYGASSMQVSRTTDQLALSRAASVGIFEELICGGRKSSHKMSGGG